MAQRRKSSTGRKPRVRKPKVVEPKSLTEPKVAKVNLIDKKVSIPILKIPVGLTKEQLSAFVDAANGIKVITENLKKTMANLSLHTHFAKNEMETAIRSTISSLSALSLNFNKAKIDLESTVLIEVNDHKELAAVGDKVEEAIQSKDKIILKINTPGNELLDVENEEIDDFPPEG